MELKLLVVITLWLVGVLAMAIRFSAEIRVPTLMVTILAPPTLKAMASGMVIGTSRLASPSEKRRTKFCGEGTLANQKTPRRRRKIQFTDSDMCTNESVHRNKSSHLNIRPITFPLNEYVCPDLAQGRCNVGPLAWVTNGQNGLGCILCVAEGVQVVHCDCFIGKGDAGYPHLAIINLKLREKGHQKILHCIKAFWSNAARTIQDDSNVGFSSAA